MGKDIINIEDEIKKQLQGLNERTGGPSANKISTKNKVFTLPGGEAGPTLSVVILDWRWVLAHYPGAFNAATPQDPDCQAVGLHKPESGLLKPAASVAKPHGENCAVCPKNQWKSDANKRGKACKNQIRLMLVPADAGPEAQPLTLYVSPSGLKFWNAYVNDLANVHQLDVIQVVTEISFNPNETYPQLQFKFDGKHAKVEQFWAMRQRNQSVVEREIELRNQAQAA